MKRESGLRPIAALRWVGTKILNTVNPQTMRSALDFVEAIFLKMSNYAV